MKMHLWCVQYKHAHKVIHAINIAACFRLRHCLKAGTNSLSFFRSWAFSGWSDGKRVRCPQALSHPCGPRAELWGPFSSYSFTAWQGWWCTISVYKESIHLMGVWYSWGRLRQKKNERTTEEWSQQLPGFPSHISRNTKNKTLFFCIFVHTQMKHS